MGKRDFARFEAKARFGRMSHIAPRPQVPYGIYLNDIVYSWNLNQPLKIYGVNQRKTCVSS